MCLVKFNKKNYKIDVKVAFSKFSDNSVYFVTKRHLKKENKKTKPTRKQQQQQQKSKEKTATLKTDTVNFGQSLIQKLSDLSNVTNTDMQRK